uniref:Uncharacterized protein n=1 Tax=Gadus morhua TaxID=8049 RepID=A0A8C5CCQ9_GADMO
MKCLLTQDVRKTEELLSKSQMTDPHLLSLEVGASIAFQSMIPDLYLSSVLSQTQYWVSVEAQIPTWQGSLLGTAPGPGPALELDNIAYRISAKKPISDIPIY